MPGSLVMGWLSVSATNRLAPSLVCGKRGARPAARISFPSSLPWDRFWETRRIGLPCPSLCYFFVSCLNLSASTAGRSWKCGAVEVSQVGGCARGCGRWSSVAGASKGRGGCVWAMLLLLFFIFFCPQRRDVLPSSNWTFVESGLVRVGFRTRGTAPLFLCSAARSELYRYFFYFLSNAYRSVGKKIECRSPTAGLRRMCGGGGNQGVCSGQLPLKEDKRRVNEGPGVSAPVLENVGSGALPCAVRGCTVALTWAGPIRRVENGCGPKPQRK